VLVGEYDDLCDIWSAGVILYVFLSGFPPFFDDNDGVVYEKIKEGKYVMEGGSWDHVSADAKDLISHMICPHNKRWNAS
jgi:calcium-dependent protein kinase